MKILFNARIHTLDPQLPDASAIVIDRERIIAVGDDSLLAQFTGGKQNMNGRVILPGLTDAHLHLQYYALGLKKIDVETKTRAECLRRVAEKAKATPPGEWILGHGWSQNDWPEGFGSAADLDAVAPHNPVYLTAKSLHAAWANTAALKLAGVTSDTPNPENGVILRDERGNATGVFLESAAWLVSSALPHNDIPEIAEAMQAAQPLLWKMGLTGVHDFDTRTSFMALQILHQRGDLKLRVTKSVPVDLLDHASALGLRSGFGDDWLRIGSVKVFMDGALGPRTAAMFQPYLGEPENRGILNLDGEQLFDYGHRAADVGLSMTVHAIGDRAIHETLDAFEQLRGYERENKLPALRHRIEHVQIVHPGDAARLGRLNVIASMQPIHMASDLIAAEKYWGERTRLAYAWRTQLEAGAPLAFGSDAPVESPNPFWGLHAAVTRRRADGSPAPSGWHAEQKLSMLEALRGYTSGAAYATGMEDRLGQLAPNFLADLIVLERDPFTCDPDELLALAPSATMIGGQWMFEQ
jgi:hypothetical protein